MECQFFLIIRRPQRRVRSPELSSQHFVLRTSFFVLLSSIEDGGATPPQNTQAATGSKGLSRHFSVRNGFRSVFSTTFFLQLLLFLLSNPFWTLNWPYFEPPEPSKSSIFIERVVIFEISTFSVRMPSFLLLGSLLASILVPFQASWGGLGVTFRVQKRDATEIPSPLFEGTCF